VPSGLWADRLLKAKRAGLNCISTCIPWNIHEPLEGQWDLTGDRDVFAFVKLAAELGLYAIIRPGPYIGADCDFGGLPAWLTAKGGMAYRTSNAAYSHYFDKYFRQVLPRLAELQVTRGGNIILIQNEDGYRQTTMPERANYLEFISQLFRRSGFDIPIITCNEFSDPVVPDAVDCVNIAADVAARIKKMRLRQGGAPILVSRYYCGTIDTWGAEHREVCPRTAARRAMEILGCAAQYNYYMFHGGTNLGFIGGGRGDHQAAFQTTSYDCDALVTEGGALTPKYYRTRLVNLLANHMSAYLANCSLQDPGVSVHDSTDTLNMFGLVGQWAVVTNNGNDEITSADISLPNGRRLTVSLEAIGATAVPVDIELTPEITLDYTNLMPLGFFQERILVLHGPAGWPGAISINGHEVQIDVPDDDEPEIIEHADLLAVVVNTDLAMRTWPLEEAIVFGPRFVGEMGEDGQYAIRGSNSAQYAILNLSDGKLTHRKVRSAGGRSATTPRLGMWKRISVCAEATSAKLEWDKMPRPRDADHLGVHYGYLWYRIGIDQARAKKRNLFLPQCEDRASLYLNGKPVGVWGRGDGAEREPVSVSMKKGANVLTVLSDNFGRNTSPMRFGGSKGLFGHVYDAKTLRVGKPRLKTAGPLNKRIVPRSLSCKLDELEAGPIWQADFSIPLTKVAPVCICFEDLPHHAAILCNDRPAGLFVNEGLNFGDVTFSAGLKKGKNVIRILLWGDVPPKAIEAFRFYSLMENLTEDSQWQFRRWELPEPSGSLTGNGRPAWYAARFKYSTPAHGKALFLQIMGARKGQIFLNGHNAGRFWNIGPQEYYYLPECWLGEVNELVIFEEQGRSPSRSKLVFRAQGPFLD